MVKPDIVIFDMDDVLCHYELGRRLRMLAALADTTARDVRAAIWDSGFEDAADSGTYPDPAAYRFEFGKRRGYPISLAEWLEARRDAMTPNEDVLEIARKIAGQTQVAIYTNNGPVVKAHFDELLPPSKLIFPQRFCSYEFGTKKPDPASFTRLVQSLGLAPENCWFIDDKKSNVEGARIAGLRAHHFRGADLLRTEAAVQGFLV
jgi:putative hydrolase of the HAD superfamily